MTDMKRLIATYALLMVLSMIVVSCEHKELCYSHPHSAKVSVEFEWSQMPAAYSPGGMRVIFYPRNGGEEIVRDFVGKKGGCVEIPSGVYDVVCFNNDTQRVKYNGADGFSSIAATTGVAQVGDVKAFRTPDYLCGGRMVAVEVEVKIGCEQIIVLPVAPMVCRYTYTVRGVKNLQNFSECVAVQQAMCSEYSVGGTFTLPDGEPAMSNWSLFGAAKGVCTVKLDAANVVTKNAVVDLSDMNSPLMMIPQKLTKWSTYSAGTAVSKHEADNANECYLEILMKLKQNDSYLIGSATEYKTVYVPFDNGTGWEPGKRYIYTLIFGGGYDDQGEPILSPITFDAATTNWVDAAGTDVNIK